jgi:3-deoxy-D-manno-octulosonic-acid transferase
VDRIQPDLFVMMETELWPNLIRILKDRNAAIALANGRISDRSFPGYRRFRKFFAPTLERIDLFLMSSELDGQRIRDMGVPEDRIRITGNTKFDAALANTPRESEQRMREILDIQPGELVFIAGSTHPGENEIVLEAYEKLLESFPGLILIVVPRHVEKTLQIVNIIEERGMERPFLRSSADEGERRNGRQVVIVDRTGELFQVFSLASVVFMGGSLVPKGGQNILEPAAWGKVVLFGPSMEDFRDAKEILVRTGAGSEIHRVNDLAAHVSAFLSDPEKTALLGRTGLDELAMHTGSARRTAEALAVLLAEES